MASGRGGCQGAVRGGCGAPAGAWPGGVPVWGPPLPGLLWHEPLQQGQLVHGAELHGLSLPLLLPKIMQSSKANLAS